MFSVVSNRTIKDWFHTLSPESVDKLRKATNLNGKPLIPTYTNSEQPFEKTLKGLEKSTGIKDYVYDSGKPSAYTPLKPVIKHRAKTAIEQLGADKSHIYNELKEYTNSEYYRNNAGKININLQEGPSPTILKIHEQLEARQAQKNPFPKNNYLNAPVPFAHKFGFYDIVPQNGHHNAKVPVIEYMIQNRSGVFDPALGKHRSKISYEYPAIREALAKTKGVKTKLLNTVRLRKADYMKASKILERMVKQNAKEAF